MMWQEATSIGLLMIAVGVLKRATEQAYFDCDDDKAGHYHDQLLAAEWRLRRAEVRS